MQDFKTWLFCTQFLTTNLKSVDFNESRHWFSSPTGTLCWTYFRRWALRKAYWCVLCRARRMLYKSWHIICMHAYTVLKHAFFRACLHKRAQQSGLEDDENLCWIIEKVISSRINFVLAIYFQIAAYFLLFEIFPKKRLLKARCMIHYLLGITISTN